MNYLIKKINKRLRGSPEEEYVYHPIRRSPSVPPGINTMTPNSRFRAVEELAESFRRQQEGLDAARTTDKTKKTVRLEITPPKILNNQDSIRDKMPVDQSDAEMGTRGRRRDRDPLGSMMHRHRHRSPEIDRLYQNNPEAHRLQQKSSESDRHGHRSPEGHRHHHISPEGHRHGHRSPEGHKHHHRSPERRSHHQRSPESHRHGHRSLEGHRHHHRSPERRRQQNCSPTRHEQQPGSPSSPASSNPSPGREKISRQQDLMSGVRHDCIAGASGIAQSSPKENEKRREGCQPKSTTSAEVYRQLSPRMRRGDMAGFHASKCIASGSSDTMEGKGSMDNNQPEQSTSSGAGAVPKAKPKPKIPKKPVVPLEEYHMAASKAKAMTCQGYMESITKSMEQARLQRRLGYKDLATITNEFFERVDDYRCNRVMTPRTRRRFLATLYEDEPGWQEVNTTEANWEEELSRAAEMFRGAGLHTTAENVETVSDVAGGLDVAAGNCQRGASGSINQRRRSSIATLQRVPEAETVEREPDQFHVVPHIEVTGPDGDEGYDDYE